MIVYRRADAVPTIDGTVDPAVVLALDGSLVACGGVGGCTSGLPCDDADPCTGGDFCSDGVCSGAAELCSSCGDAELDPGEACDRGASNGVQGGACSFDCDYVECGDPNDSHTHTASDALYILRAAVGAAMCEPCVCDTVSPGAPSGITASDALAVLRTAVGMTIPLACPACDP